MVSQDQDHTEYHNSHDQDQDQDHEQEETLSFCDLPIHNDSFKRKEDFSISSKSENDRNRNNGDEEDEDFFEFFKEDFKPAMTNPSVNKTNIIFCGKIISYKGHNNDMVPFPRQRKQNPILASTQSSCKNDGFPVHRSTKVTAMKPRWYFYVFGIVRIRTEMELREIRIRQTRSRKNKSQCATNTRFSSYNNNDDSTRKTTKENVSPRMTSLRTLWASLRAFRCRSRLVASVVKAG